MANKSRKVEQFKLIWWTDSLSNISCDEFTNGKVPPSDDLDKIMPNLLSTFSS